MDNKKNNQKRGMSRRKFINYSSAGMAGVLLGPIPGILADKRGKAMAWPQDAGNFRFHMSGQAHIDPVWLWPWS
jgi:hypothetical protein